MSKRRSTRSDVPPPGVLYTAAVEQDRYREENQRLAEILRQVISRKGLSIRSLEHKMKVGNSIYQKVLGGRTAMSFTHLFQMLDAIGLSWPEFFRLAYPAPDPEIAASEEFERLVVAILRRYGLLTDPPPAGK